MIVSGLYILKAPHLTAGLIIGPNGDVDHAAPILRWMIGKEYEDIVAYCTNKGWSIELVSAE